MKRNEIKEDHYIIKAFKNMVPVLLPFVVGAILGIFGMRTDNAVLASSVTDLKGKVSSLESRFVSTDLVAEKFDGVNKRIDELKDGIDYLIDIHVSRQK